ncbi:hypothetical protein [Ichthyobacterium seriolicida]|uniref:Major fimbrial subunit protein N-terminal domain-containing protein n=1 Tax=Ichthyobacterium seriolicida TaxID=242600 RepID=A0A1J1E3W0_9FLAO|nr:hypothetical protein [Ichthyobacterium seriolicida]BAV94732.1 hypothetical protein JBKA6_0719 [Ichthyobacterium seriolicida]
MKKIIKHSFRKGFILLAAAIFVFSCDKAPVPNPNPNDDPKKGGEVAKSESALIKSFEFKATDNPNKNLGDGDVRPTNLGLGTIVFDGLPANANLENLKPTIVPSKGAKVSPESGKVQDFTGAVKYTVTAADGKTTQDVWVTLNKKGEVRQSLLDIEAVKFVEADNKITGNDKVSDFYKALFILETPARDDRANSEDELTANGYPADFTARVSGNDIYVDVPFNTALTLVANPAFTATVTLKSLAQGVTLVNGSVAVNFGTPATAGSTDVKFSSTAPITHALFNAETGTGGGYTKTLTFVKKEGSGENETTEYEQYRIRFIYAKVPSAESDLTVNNRNEVTGIGFTREESNQPNGKLKGGTVATTLLVINPIKTGNNNGKTKTTPINLTMIVVNSPGWGSDGLEYQSRYFKTSRWSCYRCNSG